MPTELSELVTAFDERDRLREFVAKLDALAAQGLVLESDYSARKTSYGERIDACDTRVDDLKGALRRDLEAARLELKVARTRLKDVKARHEAGELSAEEFGTIERESDSRQRVSVRQIHELQMALDADSVTDLPARDSHLPQSLEDAIQSDLEVLRGELDLCRLRRNAARTHHQNGEIAQDDLEAVERATEAQERLILTQIQASKSALEEGSSADLERLVALRETHPAAMAVVRAKPEWFRGHAARRSGHTAGGQVSVARGSGWTGLRIAAIVAGAFLFISVLLTWLAPGEMLREFEFASEWGLSVTLLAGFAGIACGLLAIGFSFIRRPRTRGILQASVAAVAVLALIGGVFLGEMPLYDSYYRQLVVVREGFYLYLLAAIALVTAGGLQTK